MHKSLERTVLTTLSLPGGQRNQKNVSADHINSLLLEDCAQVHCRQSGRARQLTLQFTEQIISTCLSFVITRVCLRIWPSGEMQSQAWRPMEGPGRVICILIIHLSLLLVQFIVECGGRNECKWWKLHFDFFLIYTVPKFHVNSHTLSAAAMRLFIATLTSPEIGLCFRLLITLPKSNSNYQSLSLQDTIVLSYLEIPLLTNDCRFENIQKEIPPISKIVHSFRVPVLL